jgi:hypothetical protein
MPANGSSPASSAAVPWPFRAGASAHEDCVREAWMSISGRTETRCFDLRCTGALGLGDIAGRRQLPLSSARRGAESSGQYRPAGVSTHPRHPRRRARLMPNWGGRNIALADPPMRQIMPSGWSRPSPQPSRPSVVSTIEGHHRRRDTRIYGDTAIATRHDPHHDLSARSIRPRGVMRPDPPRVTRPPRCYGRSQPASSPVPLEEGDAAPHGHRSAARRNHVVQGLSPTMPASPSVVVRGLRAAGDFEHEL